MTSTYYITSKLEAVALLAAITLVCCSNCTTNEWQNEMILDPQGDFQMFWNLTKENITIEVQVRTKGYVGLGFSPHGGMKAADIVIGWVNDSQVNLQDRYATGYIEPIIDDNQDYNLISGFENDTHTVLRFTRLLETCDNQDSPILDGTMHIIYAWGNDDPMNNIEYHGGENRGTKAFNPFAPNVDDFLVTDDMHPWDFQMPKVTLPPVETTYWCQFMKYPATKKKQHAVGLKILVQPGNEKIVHHAFISQCLEPPSDESQLNGPGFNCETKSTTCITPIVGWSLGSPSETLPPHVGFPFGEIDKPTFYVVQIHYHNPSLRSDIVDQTTIRLMITDELRPNEGGLLSIVSLSMIVPPQQENFTHTSICPSECTTKMFPKDGINIFGAFLHGHLTTSKIHVRHFRDNVELPLIIYNNNYDFNFQFRADLVKEVKVLQGDILTAQCEYNTMNESSITVGGIGVHEEMCNVFLLHYPAAKLRGAVKTGPYLELLQILKNAERKQSMNNSSNGLKMPENDYVKNFDTSILTKQDIADLSYIQTFGKMEGVCIGQGTSVEFFKTEYPQNITKAISYQKTSCQNAKKGT